MRFAVIHAAKRKRLASGTLLRGAASDTAGSK